MRLSEMMLCECSNNSSLSGTMMNKPASVDTTELWVKIREWADRPDATPDVLFELITAVDTEVRRLVTGRLPVEEPDMSVYDRVAKIVSLQLGVPESAILPEKCIYVDLGADSMDRIELLMTLEDEFNIEISTSDATWFDERGSARVERIAAAVETYLRNK